MVSRHQLFEIIKNNPSIPGIKSDDDLRSIMKLNSRVVFVLYGNLLSIKTIVKKLKDSGHIVFVNVDLIEGFSSKDIVIEYLKQNTQFDGILSSKATMIKSARALDLLTIHRFFVIDSISFSNISKQVDISKPDCIEMMPGCMPRVLTWIKETINIPIISGGLVCDKEDAIAAIKAGAVAVSSTNRTVWGLSLQEYSTMPSPVKPKKRILEAIYPAT